MEVQFEQALLSGNLVVAIGVAVPVFVTFIATCIQGKVAPRVHKIFSIVRAVTATGCAGMVGAALVDPGKWWVGLAMSFLGLLTNQTTVDMVRELLPDRKPGP